VRLGKLLNSKRNRRLRMYATELVQKLLEIVEQEGDFKVMIPAPDWERMDKLEVEMLSLQSESIPQYKPSEGLRVLPIMNFHREAGQLVAEETGQHITIKTIGSEVDNDAPIRFFNYIVLDCG
jgi:hypothetical protein